MTTRNCPHCQAELPAIALKCRQCGAESIPKSHRNYEPPSQSPAGKGGIYLAVCSVLLILFISLFASTGGNSSSTPAKTSTSKQKETMQTPTVDDWHKAYNTAKVQWSNSAFRQRFGSQTPSEMCGWIMTYGINEGFNAYDGVTTARERDVYNGCIQYFSDIGIY